MNTKLKHLLTAIIGAIALYSGPGAATSYTIAPIPLPPGTSSVTPYGMSDTGMVVGLTEGNAHGFVYDGTQSFIFNCPGSPVAAVFDVNSAGQIVGQCDTQGFLYDGTSFTSIVMPGAQFTSARGLNNVGQVVGYYGDGAAVVHGFLKTGSQVTVLDAPGSAGRTQAINVADNGDVVGFYKDIAGQYHGFVYSGGTFRTLDDPDVPAGSGYGTLLRGINSFGQVVGSIKDPTGDHGVIYQDGAFTRFDEPGAGFSVLADINNSGQIAGAGTDGFIATPVPIPATGLLLISAVGALTRRRHGFGH